MKRRKTSRTTSRTSRSSPAKALTERSNPLMIGEKNGDQYFQSFDIHGQTFALGDTVEVKIVGVKTNIACIMALWTDPQSQRWMEIRYFAQFAQLSPPVQQHIRSSLSNGTCELKQLYETDQIDEQPTSCLTKKVVVVYDHQTANDHADDEEEDADESEPADENTTQVYHCSYFYSMYARVMKKNTSLSCDERSIQLYSQRAIFFQPQPRSDPSPSRNVVVPKAKQSKSSRPLLARLEQACQRLQLSCVPESLPGREHEHDQVESILHSALINGVGSSPLYITGVQGIGKSATIAQCLTALEHRRHTTYAETPFKVLNINALKLPNPDMIYFEIWQQLFLIDGRRKIGSDRACAILTSYFNASCSSHDDDASVMPNHRPFLFLVIDELDNLMTKKNTVLYNLLEWSRVPSSKLMLIGIANTMDLPEQLETKIRSRFGVQRVIFHSYTSDELERIVLERIEHCDVFDPDSIRIQAKKIAQISGRSVILNI